MKNKSILNAALVGAAFQVGLAHAIVADASSGADGSAVTSAGSALSNCGAYRHPSSTADAVGWARGSSAQPSGYAVRILGLTEFSEAGIAEELASLLGRPGCFEPVNSKVEATLTSLLVKRGMLAARVKVSGRSLDGTALDIDVEETRLQAIVVSAAGGATSGIAPLDDVRAGLQRLLCEDSVRGQSCAGRVLLKSRIERALLVVGEATNTRLAGSLDLTGERGPTLEVLVNSSERGAGEIGFDSYGGSSTGRVRAQGRYTRRDLLSAGDALSLSVQSSNSAGSRDMQVDYNTSALVFPWRVGVSLGRSQYKLSGDFEVLEANGKATTANLYATYPAFRSLDATVDLRGELEHASLLDDNLSGTLRSHSNSARLSLLGWFADSLAGLRASSSWRLAFTSSEYKAAQQAQADVLARKTANRVQFSFNRLQALQDGVAAKVNIFGQLAEANLPGYAKVFLGGPGAVRAYPVGEAGGDSAMVGQFQLGWNTQMPLVADPSWRLGSSVFYDRGWTKFNADALPGIVKNSRVLAGAGLEISLSKADYFASQLFVARTVGTGASLVDGKRTRLGINLSIPF